ncbi:Arc family DNA-binding protein [Roseomonas sp. CAU 1739]|uniref:Arc family DNA-binding protein n=1 Tax=Roseomonas sp. CAU 1739 TaxID=3140364 RepID=UPI00325C08EE
MEGHLGRDDPKLLIRLPAGLKAWLATTAAANHRSMSKEVEFRLETAMRGEKAAEPASGEASPA